MKKAKLNTEVQNRSGYGRWTWIKRRKLPLADPDCALKSILKP